MINLISRAVENSERIAIKSNGEDYSYQQLLDASRNVALHLLDNSVSLNGARVAFLIPAGFDYVAVQWGVWLAGGIAVPLCEKHPLSSILYVLDDTKAKYVFCSNEFKEFLLPIESVVEAQFKFIEKVKIATGELPDVPMESSAMIIYTSGTTGKPKGVVTTHHNIEAQITSLITSWEWDKDDHILNVLPMHHLHGIINILSCALWSGACCEFLSKFDPKSVFDLFCKRDINLFMAVPTIYYKLIAYYQELPLREQKEISECLKGFRLMVSGSAALPVSVFHQWKQISGKTLLERYGMSEIGMGISNPYRGERKVGYIGRPLIGVQIRLADENDQKVKERVQGEIQIKGANVFKEYWGKPRETEAVFTKDGWFKSGDIAVYEKGNYRFLGRSSVDIINSGGFKISALEIEEVLRKHPDIYDCGIVGIPDEEWGEIIGAGIVLKGDYIDLVLLEDWIKERLPVYQVPSKYIILEDLPRNVLGKVTKNELKEMFLKNGCY